MSRWWRWVAIGLLLSACSNSKTQSSKPTSAPPVDTPAALEASVVLEPPGHNPVEVAVELARTPPERAKGLMFRSELPVNHGMLFVFDRGEHLSFWMKNTPIPLDMIFITPELRVLGVVENTEPFSTQSRSVPGLAQYVLEVNAGFAQTHRITAGTTVRLRGVSSP